MNIVRDLKDMCRNFISFGLLTIILAISFSAKANPIANQCIGCHGAQGVSPMPNAPHLAGQKAEYIARQLLDFKSDKRKDTTMFFMNSITKGLSEADIMSLAEYFSGLDGQAARRQVEQNEVPKLTPLKREQIDRGFMIADRKCSLCHFGDDFAARNIFPHVAFQQEIYLFNQMKAFRDLTRTSDWSDGFKNKWLRSYTDDQLQDLAAYFHYVSVRPPTQ